MGNSPKLPVYENARRGTAIPFPPLMLYPAWHFLILIVTQLLFP